MKNKNVKLYKCEVNAPFWIDMPDGSTFDMSQKLPLHQWMEVVEMEGEKHWLSDEKSWRQLNGHWSFGVFNSIEYTSWSPILILSPVN